MLYHKQQQELESAKFSILYKGTLLNRSDATEIQEFNEMLKHYQQLLNWSMPELPQQEVQKKLDILEDFSKFKKKLKIRNFERAE